MQAPCQNCPGPARLHQLQMQLQAGMGAPTMPSVATEPSTPEPRALIWILAIALLVQTVVVVAWIVRAELREQAREAQPVKDETPEREAVRAGLEEILADLDKIQGADDYRFAEIGTRLAKLLRQSDESSQSAKDVATYLQTLIEDRLIQEMARQQLDREEARRKAESGPRN